jgi:hypothetical protein
MSIEKKNLVKTVVVVRLKLACQKEKRGVGENSGPLPTLQLFELTTSIPSPTPSTWRNASFIDIQVTTTASMPSQLL